MGFGISGSRIGAFVVALLAAAALCAMLATDAGAVKLVGKDGRVYACYKAKGKRKGAVRLVPKKVKCRKGERKISWNGAGRAGEAGSGGENGENGTGGETGAAGETAATVKGLEGRIAQLTSKVTSLEGVLKGITNTELLGALTKLQGISGTQLQETVASLADVKALCTQATKLTEQVNTVGGLFGGIKLGGTIPPLLGIVVPSAPTSLAAFGC
jgi:hypothetical protein